MPFAPKLPNASVVVGVEDLAQRSRPYPVKAVGIDDIQRIPADVSVEVHVSTEEPDGIFTDEALKLGMVVPRPRVLEVDALVFLAGFTASSAAGHRVCVHRKL